MSSPATTVSRNGFGCIVVFLKHLIDFAKKRNDIRNLEAYQKNGIFEELCHLVEQNGDSSVHPESYWLLWNLYRGSRRLEFGNQIIAQLDTDRNHYEVYLMMIEAYPQDWIERYWKYYMATPTEYEHKYDNWIKRIPIEIAHARLITDTLRSINFLYVAKKLPRNKLSDENEKLLDILIEKGEFSIKKQKNLIERDLGYGALSLVDSLDESIFQSSDIFFSVVLDLWKSLRLV